MTELEVMTIIALTTNERDRLVLRLLYLTGARVGEIANLRWRDVQPNRDGRGQVTLFGKGDKTRFVVIKPDLYASLIKYRDNADDNDAVFPSRKGGTPLSARQINQLVKDIAHASIKKDISPHWLRHAHATHSLDRGTAPQLVQATLGHESLSTTGKYAHARPHQSSGLDLPG
ncbi:tyrosine-type recombinase/integrase [Scytonema sp. NUACC26]|uniref:tyrosine-type recombinase/integrase n=1 Tax=Scytonema sp. NUACC26 TaxID=3140176 RepID=UPI0038B32E3E